MPPKANNTKPIWSALGPDGIQLFRDYYFGKYPKGTPATVVFDDPSRNYSSYSKEGFYRHHKATVNKVETYKEFGTGLSSNLLQKLDLENPPSPEECSPNHPVEDVEDTSDDEDDDSYNNSDRDDLSLGSFESESFLGRLQISNNNNNNNKKVTPTTTTMRKNKDERNYTQELPPVKSFSTSSAAPPFLTPVLVECCGGNLSGTVPMLGGVEYEFYIADDGKSVVQKTFVPDECLDAKKMFYRHGLSDQHVIISGYQTDINKKKKMSMVQVSERDKYFFETTLFSFPYEIESSFYDEYGDKVDTIFEGRGHNGLLWGYFYLKKKLEGEKKRTKARILRDNRRSAPDEDFNNYGRNVSRNFGTGGGSDNNGMGGYQGGNGNGNGNNGLGGYQQGNSNGNNGMGGYQHQGNQSGNDGIGDYQGNTSGYHQMKSPPYSGNNNTHGIGNQHFVSPTSNRMNNSGGNGFHLSNFSGNNNCYNDHNLTSPSKSQSQSTWAANSGPNTAPTNNFEAMSHHHVPAGLNTSFQSPTNQQSYHTTNGMMNPNKTHHNFHQGTSNNNTTPQAGPFKYTPKSTQQNHNAVGIGTPMMSNASNGFKEMVHDHRSSNEGFDESMLGNNKTSGSKIQIVRDPEDGSKIRIVRDPNEIMRLLGQRGASIRDETQGSDSPEHHCSSPISLETVSSKDL